MPDSFTIDPGDARKRLGLEHDDVTGQYAANQPKRVSTIKCAPRTGKGSRYPGECLMTCVADIANQHRQPVCILFRLISSHAKDRSPSNHSCSYIFQAVVEF